MTLKTGLILGGIALVAIGTPLVLEMVNQRSDKELILEALDESIKASKDGRPGGVLEHISNSLVINNETYRPSTRQIADFIRQKKPNIEFTNKEPAISGDTASLTSPAKLSILVASVRVPDVTLQFKKESARKWLVIPTRKWRLTEVNIPPETIQQIEAQAGLFGGF